MKVIFINFVVKEIVMKNIHIILLLFFSIFSFQISAQKIKNQKEKFVVSGNLSS